MSNRNRTTLIVVVVVCTLVVSLAAPVFVYVAEWQNLGHRPSWTFLAGLMAWQVTASSITCWVAWQVLREHRRQQLIKMLHSGADREVE